MIEFHTIHAPQQPDMISDVLSLLTEAFGPEEGDLERLQLSGAEATDNEDILFTAYENGTLLSTIHLTMNRAHPAFACLGGMITTPAARGKGLANHMFGQACRYYDDLGGGALFLGTSNPIAAHLYAKHGFSFITGSNIMARITSDTLLGFYKQAYTPDTLTYKRVGAFCRIPIIPLVAARGRDLLMDANVGLLSSDFVTQISCCGLYPRFLQLMASGDAWCVTLPSGAICAVCTVRDQRDGSYIDAFAYPGFEETLPQLLAMGFEGRVQLSACIANCDRAKQALFTKLGFTPAGTCNYDYRGLQIPCTKFVR